MIDLMNKKIKDVELKIRPSFSFYVPKKEKTEFVR